MSLNQPKRTSTPQSSLSSKSVSISSPHVSVTTSSSSSSSQNSSSAALGSNSIWSKVSGTISENQDNEVNIIFVGRESSGKTSLRRCFIEGFFLF
jgi:hypothetical protein